MLSKSIKSFKINSLVLFFITVSSLSLEAHSLSSFARCQKIFESEILPPFTILKKRESEIPPVNFHNTSTFISELQRADAMGYVMSRYDEKFETSLYFAATATPDKNGQIPIVDPNSKGVVIFLHGSGTTKSSGKNFYGQMNVLADLGYSSVGLDLPFHADGPLHQRLHDSKEFFIWLEKFIDHVASFGKPVTLVGHSFGSMLIAEYASRHPFTPHSLYAMSLVSFADPKVKKWYKRDLRKLPFFKNLEINPLGFEFSLNIERQVGYDKNQRPDPTVLNPDLKLYILAGQNEEFYPPGFDLEKFYKSFFRKAKITIAPGVGHGLFHHRDENNNPLVIREILRALGENISDMLDLKVQKNKVNDATPVYEKMAQKYAFDPLFRDWMDKNYGINKAFRIKAQRNTYGAQKALTEYKEAFDSRLDEVFKEIYLTEKTNPDFFEKNKDLIEKSKRDKSKAILWVYLAELEK